GRAPRPRAQRGGPALRAASRRGDGDGRGGRRRKPRGAGARRARDGLERRDAARARRRARRAHPPSPPPGAWPAGRGRRRRRTGPLRGAGPRGDPGAGGGVLPGRVGGRRRLDRAGDAMAGATTGRRVAIQTLGCKGDAYDTATIADRLRGAGCVMVAPGEPADVVIVNSCTVTDAADAESRRLARRARRSNPAARVILTGCYAQTQPLAAA